MVSEDDPAFQHPTKPVGAFYDKETAERIAAERGYTMVEDAGRGYRQVVPSPKPVDIVEKSAIQALFDAGNVVIAVGGGGIPVVRRDGTSVRHSRRHRQGLRLRASWPSCWTPICSSSSPPWRRWPSTSASPTRRVWTT